MTIIDSAAHAALANAQNAQAYVSMAGLGSVSMIEATRTSFQFKLRHGGLDIAEVAFPQDGSQPCVYELHGGCNQYMAPSAELIVSALGEIARPFIKKERNV